MDTKLKGDIAEHAAIVQALKRGWGVLKPIGDRLPYDLAFDVSSTLVRVQVKAAWFYERIGNYVVDNRRTKTNRRQMIRDAYQVSDFDFALVHVVSLICSMSFLSQCSSAMAVRSTLSKLAGVNENLIPPNIVMLGS